MGIIAKYKFNQNTYADFIPTFNNEFTNYTITDEIGADEYTIRTIESDSLPTSMKFGASTTSNRERSLLELFECNTSQLTDMSNMFYGCSNLTSLNLSCFNTEKVTDMNYMFGDCSCLTSLDFSSFNTQSVTNMSNMFRNCWGLTSLNLSSFDTQNVTNMNYMFGECSGLTSLDISSFNTQNVINMQNMFYNCSSLTSLDVSNFNTEKATSMSYMFYGCENLISLNLSSFNTQSVSNMSNMFRSCSSLTSLNLSSFNTENVSNMTGMFRSCSSLTSLDLTNFNTQKVSSMTYLFSGWTSTQKVYISSKWTLGTNFTPIFIATFAYTIAKYKFNNTAGDCLPTITDATTSQWDYNDEVDGTITTRTIGTNEELTITNISFKNKTSLLTLDYLNFTNAITNASNMFNGCTALISIDTSNWNTSAVTNMSSMFQSCAKLTNLDLSHFNVDSVTSMRGMFSGCSALTTLDLSNWDTSSVTSMRDMFSGCSALTTLDLSHFNVHGVTSMVGMFYYCVSLTTLNLSNWSASAVTDMSAMFQNCVKLTTLDLSSWKVDSVTSMGAMFFNCGSLTTLDLSNWNTSKVSNMSNMFNGCSALTTVDLSNFDTSKVSAWGSPSGTKKLTDIGLVYASSSTINSIVTNWLGTSVARNVYYMDAELSELTTRANITYVPYSQSVLSCSEEITLRSNGDVYDELDLLTGQVIQRIGEDNEILEEEIVRTVELDGEIGFYENSYIHTSSNEITPEFEFQPTLTNCYVVSDLKPNTQYTVLFEGNPTLMSLGGTTIENPISKTVITSGEVDNILWFDTSVSKIMILEGDLTNRDVEYFTGVKSSQKIEVQLRGNTPYFAKGGRK